MPLRRRRIARCFLIAAVAVTVLAHRSISQMFWGSTAVHRVHTSEKVVALTFDDGPHPKYTPEILKILRENHVRATFFMIGKSVDRYPGIVKEAIRDGNLIGNHTYSHPKDIDEDSRAQTEDELDRCGKSIERVSGRSTHLFRPPKGLMDETVYSVAKQKGYRTILWTVCADNHRAKTPAMMADRVLRNVYPGAIILIHDGYLPMRWRDVKATELIIQGLRRKGYRFATVQELLELEKKPRLSSQR